MSRQLLRWCCAWATLSVLAGAMSAATHFVGWKRIGSGPAAQWYWFPTNLTIRLGDTVTWTNLGFSHSVNPGPNALEPFCGTGTNEIDSCAATFNVAGLFPYDCYQHLPTMTGSVRVLAPPAVAITNPLNNALFPTHANVQIQASATDLDGAVTNVQFLSNGVSFATSGVAPFTATLSNVAPGNYTLRARAMDNSALVTTSAPVGLRVIGPPTLLLRPATNGPLQFSYNTVTGVSYVVEGSAMLPDFAPIATNAGTGDPQQFPAPNPPPAQNFFRLRLQ